MGIASCAALKCINLELKIVSRDSLFLIQPSLFKPAIQTAVMEGMTAMEPQAHSNRQSFETIRYTTNAMESAIGVRSMFKDSNMSKQVTVVRSSAFCSQAHLGKVKMIQNSSTHKRCRTDLVTVGFRCFHLFPHFKVSFAKVPRQMPQVLSGCLGWLSIGFRSGRTCVILCPCSFLESSLTRGTRSDQVVARLSRMQLLCV